jgi:hypothetical protein
MSNFDDSYSARNIDDSETILRRVIDIIATARNIPLSATPMINRDEIIELLEEALNRYPDDLRQARWLLKERDDFLLKAKRDSDELLDGARANAERMVQRTEVVRASEHRARQIVEAAENASRKMRMETEDFIDQRLASFQIVLDKVQRTIEAGRERLNGSVSGHTGAVPTVRPGQAEPADDDPGGSFFDQDLT